MDAADILKEAQSMVTGPRHKTHGAKEDNFSNIASLWSAYLINYHAEFPGLSAAQAADLMELMKVARRQAGDHNPDDYVDGAGYAACAGELAEIANRFQNKGPQTHNTEESVSTELMEWV